MSTHDNDDLEQQGPNLLEMPWQDVHRHLGELLNDLHSVLATIQSAFDRDNRNLALFSLGFRAGIEFERLRKWLREPNDVLAWCVRNLYEIDLTLKQVSSSEDLMKEWIGQAFKDEEDIIRGFQALRDQYSEAVNTRDDRMKAALEQFRLDHGFSTSGPPHVRRSAEAVGRETEYQLFYKFLSKYIHPTSWMVNRGSERTNSGSDRNLLVGIAQVLIRRIRAALETALALEGQVHTTTVRAIPWRRSSYDMVPHAIWRASHYALRPELDKYATRWSDPQCSRQPDDIVGLELFARSDYIAQRFDWPSWPAWEEHSVRLYGAADHFREIAKSAEMAPLAEEDSAIIRNARTDIGESRFERAWAAGKSLNWFDAVAAAVTVPNSIRAPSRTVVTSNP